MTRDVHIDLSPTTGPTVVIDGVRVAVKLDVTFHKEGGLMAKKITISEIPLSHPSWAPA